ncbi:hypothetical protein HQ393_17440 (plasmid) [Chitinibacter bivalviorum]|uniref:PglD N-terminal domain-containing protein n=1 Tax=Chitinibacter bivalviorum TaxID=2739434 RepID=A0A7H9BNF2_9NEIS|nr:hypothetical protein [Chitinibacter bivalviorum]QLG90095.1 hypothetical protein HQ393_17440 [Chitinibacter bivalviorum]
MRQYRYWLRMLCFGLVLRPDGDKRADAKKVIIIGANQPGLVLAKNMQEHPFLKMDFVGFFDDRTEDRLPNVQKGKLLGGLKEVNSYVKAHNIQQIYISLPMTAQPRVVDLLEQLQDSTVSIYFVPDLLSLTSLMRALTMWPGCR